MNVPFTVEQFFDVFGRYNEAVWPTQWLLIAMAILAIVSALRVRTGGGRIVSGVLALFWLWSGAAYHFAFFQAINPAAVLFGALFVAQAALLFWYGVQHRALDFRPRMDGAGVLGAVLIVYALAVYPLLGYLFGHRYPEAPTFGLPCPTTIFTLGMLLWSRPPMPRSLLVIPILWSLIGATAALQLGVYEDVGLLVAGVVAALLVPRVREHRLRMR